MAIETVPAGDDRCGFHAESGDTNYICEDCLRRLQAEMEGHPLNEQDPTIQRLLDQLEPGGPGQN